MITLNEAADRRTGVYDHDWWCEALLERYLPPIGPGQSATLSVDRAGLADLTGLDETAAAESLAEAVRQSLGPRRLFNRYVYLTLKWRNGDRRDAPPALPLLALSVVAAMDMGCVSGINANNFYVPFRRLLDPMDREVGAPADFTERIEYLWSSLDTWLEEDLAGERGRSTFKKPRGTFPFIGYSLEQALVRASDRTLVRQFLADVKETEGLGDRPEELRRYLALWAGRLGQRGAALRTLALDPSLAHVCDSILASELANSAPASMAGRGSARIAVYLELLPFSLGLIPACPPDAPAELEASIGGEAPETFRQVAAGWYDPGPLQRRDIGAALSRGVWARSASLDFSLTPAPVIALRYDDQLGAYVSVDRIAFDEDHLLLCETALLGEVQDFLSASGVDARLRDELASRLPDGWALIERVQFNARPTAQAPNDLARLLGTTVGARARLVGGLRVGPLPRTYLTGGAPILSTPPALSRTITLSGDGLPHPVHASLDGSQTELPLQRFDLGAGHYVVDLGDHQVTFDLVETLIDELPPGLGSLEAAGLGSTFSGYVQTSGHPSPAPAPRYVSLKKDETAVALGAAPTQSSKLSTPAWLDELAGGLAWSVVEVIAPFPVAWVAIERPGAAPAIHPIGDLAAQPTNDRARLWTRLVRAGELAIDASADDRRRWAAYVKVARSWR